VITIVYSVSILNPHVYYSPDDFESVPQGNGIFFFNVNSRWQLIKIKIFCEAPLGIWMSFRLVYCLTPPYIWLDSPFNKWIIYMKRIPMGTDRRMIKIQGLDRSGEEVEWMVPGVFYLQSWYSPNLVYSTYKAGVHQTWCTLQSWYSSNLGYLLYRGGIRPIFYRINNTGSRFLEKKLNLYAYNMPTYCGKTPILSHLFGLKPKFFGMLQFPFFWFAKVTKELFKHH